MRELIIAEFITLDGVIQAPGGADEDTEGGFTHGGWTHPFWHDDIGAHFFQAMSQVDALLLGRKTWQIHGGAFEPKAGDPFADAMNDIRLHVYPLVLGGGKRLYPEGKRLDLTLVEAAPLPTGVVFMRYRRTA